MFRSPDPRAGWHLKIDTDLNRHSNAETNLRHHQKRNQKVPRPHDAYSTPSTFDLLNVSNPLAYNNNLETETSSPQIKNVYISSNPFSIGDLSCQPVLQSSGSSSQLLLDTAASSQNLKTASTAASSQYLEAASPAANSKYLEAAFSAANSQYMEAASSAASSQYLEAASSSANFQYQAAASSAASSQYLEAASSEANSQFLEVASFAANSQYLEAVPFSKFKMEASRTQLQKEGSSCSQYELEAMTMKASSARSRFPLRTRSKLPFGVKYSSKLLLEAENSPKFPFGADNSPEFPIKADTDLEFPLKADNSPKLAREADNYAEFILEPDIFSNFVLGVDNNPVIHHRGETSAHIQVSPNGNPILFNSSISPIQQVETRTSRMNLTSTSETDRLEYIEENTTARETQQLDCKENKFKVNEINLQTFGQLHTVRTRKLWNGKTTIRLKLSL